MTISRFLPSGWTSSCLAEIAVAQGGGTPSRSDASFWTHGTVPWVSPKDMKSRVLNSSEDLITERALAKLSLVPPQSVLIVVRSGILSRTLPVALNAVPVTINQDMRAFVPEVGVEARFVAWQLIWRESEILSACSKNGTTVASIEGPALARFPLHVAPTAEQTRIVEKLEELLSDLDAGVAELKAAQKKLALYRQSLLKAAVESALTADWRARRAARDEPLETGAELLARILIERRTRWEARQLAKFKEQGKTPPKGWQAKYPEPIQPDTSRLPTLPSGWTWATIDQLAVVVRGASPRPAGDPRYFGGSIPWITVGSLTCDDGIYLDEVDLFVTEAGKSASRYIEPNTLLLTNSGATLGVPKITRIGGCINDGSVALLDLATEVQLYLYFFLTTQTAKLRALNQGAAQPNLNTDIVRRIVVPVCPDAEMRAITEKLTQATLDVKIQVRNIFQALRQSTAQRKNLLKAAFSGQLVPQDPNDEPASALLARIRAEREARESPRQGRRGRKNADAHSGAAP